MQYKFSDFFYKVFWKLRVNVWWIISSKYVFLKLRDMYYRVSLHVKALTDWRMWKGVNLCYPRNVNIRKTVKFVKLHFRGFDIKVTIYKILFEIFFINTSYNYIGSERVNDDLIYSLNRTGTCIIIHDNLGISVSLYSCLILYAICRSVKSIVTLFPGITWYYNDCQYHVQCNAFYYFTAAIYLAQFQQA